MVVLTYNIDPRIESTEVGCYQVEITIVIPGVVFGVFEVYQGDITLRRITIHSYKELNQTKSLKSKIGTLHCNCELYLTNCLQCRIIYTSKYLDKYKCVELWYNLVTKEYS